MKSLHFLALLFIGLAGAASPSLAACTGGLVANCPAASNLSGTADSVWVDQPSLAPHTGRKATPNEVVGAAAGAYPVLAATKMPVKPAAQLPARPAGSRLCHRLSLRRGNRSHGNRLPCAGKRKRRLGSSLKLGGRGRKRILPHDGLRAD